MVGVILPHLATSQLSYLVTMNANKYNYVLFQKQFLPPLQKIYTMVLPLSDAARVKDVLIGTDLQSAQIMSKMASPSRKIYYVWELEWLQHQCDYLSTVSILRDKNIEVIARSEDHKRQIELFNCDVKGVIDDFNHDQLMSYLSTPKEKAFTNWRIYENATN